MFFRFPDGTTEISVEQQNFQVEHEDKDGHGYFRAPSHFAPAILDFKGFAQVDRPEGAMEDLPSGDPGRDDTISVMAGQIEALRLEAETTRAELVAMTIERDRLATELAKLQPKKAA